MIDAETSMPPSPRAGSVVLRLFAPRVQLAMSVVAGAALALGVLIGATLDLPGAAAFVWASLGIGLVYGVRAAIDAIRGLVIDIDVLMVVGALLAAGIGHPAEGALLLFLFTLSGALEDLALDRTRREVEALHRLMPKEAIVLKDGAWCDVSPDALRPGDRIKIRPGDLIPADAKVQTGQSSIDQSTLTGESMPRSVVPGETIYAGTVNLDSAIEAEVLRSAAESSLQRVMNLVTVAREAREPIQRVIDRWGQPYAWGVLLASLLIFLIWWLAVRHSAASAAYTAITFLIVLSPCALIIATPTATLCAIARGARAGVLFKGGQSIERLSRVGALCFDKTGTLTFGKPRLIEIIPVGWSDSAKLLSVAAALEHDSTHPIARAVREGATARALPVPALDDAFHAAGRGIRATLEGDPVAVGGYEFVETVIPPCLRARTSEIVKRLQGEGRLAPVVAAGGEHGAAAVLSVADELRPGAAHALEELRAIGISPIVMLTGDTSTTAAHVARDLAIDQVLADLLPEDKVRHVQEIKTIQRANTARPGVAFVGDGVNDAPALASADVALAIGSIGSDAALESSDIVLLNDDLSCVPWAIRLARRARALLRFNIAAAMSVILLMGVVTLVGSLVEFQVPMWLGVAAHEGGTLFVVLNAMRLLWMKR